MKNQNKRQPKSQPKSQQQPQKLQSQQFLKHAEKIDIKKLLVPASILVSTLLIIASLFFSYNIIFNNENLVTQKNFKSNLSTALNSAQGNAGNDQGSQEEFPDATADIDDDPILGDKAKAQVIIVEFSDYECPFCKRHFQQVDKKLREEYINAGKAALVFRDYPLDFHDPLATQQAMAGECVQEFGGDTKYFEYHDLLFTNTSSNGNGLQKSQLYDFATQIGIDRAKFTECLDSEKYKSEVQNDIGSGTRSGVEGTPGFIIGKLQEDGKTVKGKFIGGAYPYDAFKQVLDEQIGK